MAGKNQFQPADMIKERLREKTPEELTEEMEALSSTPNYDVELLCAYLDVLEEKAPVLPDGYSPAADFEAFQEAHSELFSVAEPKREGAASAPAPRKQRLLRFRRAAAILAAMLCLVLVIAEAHTPGTMERIVEWGAEVFMLRPASGKMELPEASENGFLSLQEALDHYGVMGAVIPTYVPKRFALNKLTVVETEDSVIIGGRYIAESDSALLVRVVIAAKENYIFEKELGDNYVSHEANGIAFATSSNFDEQRATWSINGCTCSVSGDITRDELYEVLDSIKIKE